MTRDADDEAMVRYIEGIATDAEVADLETRLAADPSLRREFVRLAHLQALFHDLPRPAAMPTHSRTRFRTRTFAMAGVAAAVLIGSVLWMLLNPSAELPTITVLSGQVSCIHGHSEIPLHVGDPLEAGDRVTLAAHADLTMSWKDRSAVHVRDASDLVVNATSDATLTLNAGELIANITHDPRRPFRIVTPDGVVTDLGTSFTVRHDHTRTWVGVDVGAVSFANASGAVTITAGWAAAAASGQAPVLMPMAPIVSDPKPAVSVTPPQAPTPVPGPPSATGTVTALDPQRKAFTLTEDGTGLANDYRAYFAGGHSEAMQAQIAGLRVGDHLTLTYIDKEGRRVLTIVSRTQATPK